MQGVSAMTSAAIIDAPQHVLAIAELRLRGLLPGDFSIVVARGLGHAAQENHQLIDVTLQQLDQAIQPQRVIHYPILNRCQALNRSIVTRLVRQLMPVECLALGTPGAYIYRSALSPKSGDCIYWLDDGSMASSPELVARDYEPQSRWQSFVRRIAGSPLGGANEFAFTCYPEFSVKHASMANDFSFLSRFVLGGLAPIQGPIALTAYVDTYHRGVPADSLIKLLEAVRDQLQMDLYIPHRSTPEGLRDSVERDLGVRVFRPKTPVELWSLSQAVSAKLLIAPGSAWRTIDILRRHTGWRHQVAFVELSSWFLEATVDSRPTAVSLKRRGEIYRRAQDLYLLDDSAKRVTLMANPT